MGTLKKFASVGTSVIFGFFLFLFGFPEALAQLPTYTPLVNLPGLQDGPATIPAFINRVYTLTIVLGSLLGVVKIALAGAKYSMGDVITVKEDAKRDIRGVLLGLVVLLAPWIVLNTIYPGLLNLDFTKNIDNVGVPLDPSHDYLRDDIRDENPFVVDTFTGALGSAEHIAFVKSCKDGGGEVALAEDGGVVECRAASLNGSNSNDAPWTGGSVLGTDYSSGCNATPSWSSFVDQCQAEGGQPSYVSLVRCEWKCYNIVLPEILQE